jgi:dolichol kinase
MFVLIGAASQLLRSGRISPAATRKVVHIGVSHWWILYLVFGASTWVGVAGVGVMIMGGGDGMAALVGQRYGTTPS